MSKPRTVEEVKNDIRERVGRRAPFLHADKNEAEEALAKMTNFEGESWAAAWNALGERWEASARASEKTDNAAPVHDHWRRKRFRQAQMADDGFVLKRDRYAFDRNIKIFRGC